MECVNHNIQFVREHKAEPESISLTELFNLYNKESSITTTVAKFYISGRVQSPAVAILNEFKTVSFSESDIKNYTSSKKL